MRAKVDLASCMGTRLMFLPGALLLLQEVIRAATVNAAALFQMEDRLGLVKVGFLADLIVVEGDPTSDLGVLTQPETCLKAVVKGGRVCLDRLSGGGGG